MNSRQFDSLTRAITTRRTAVTGIVGSVAALLGATTANEAAAHNPAPACNRLKDPKRRRACRRRARRRNRNHCRSQPATVTCAGRCGKVHNNCRKTVSCLCPADRVCLANQSCGRLCAVDETCPAGCTCGVTSVEGGRHCFPDTLTSCLQTPQICTSTVQCPPGQVCAFTGCGDAARCVPVCAA
jgi:hypothetical protein